MMNKRNEKREASPLIAHVIHRLDFGGLENGLVNLINHMPADRYRHAIVCLTEYTEFSQRLQRPVTLIALHKREGQDPALYWRLWRTFRRLRPDIVHTRNLASIEAQLPAWLAGVPCRIHGEHGWDRANPRGMSGSAIWIRRALRPFVHRYVALSGEIEGFLRDNIHVPPRRITRICNGVDTERFHPATEGDTPGPIADFDPGQRIVIGTIGRMSAVKDQLTLTRAFIQLVRQVPELREQVCLFLIGEGPLRKACQQLIDAAGLADICWLPGARDDTPELLRMMDIFVLPSLAEGISNTILEAMASGLPVIATRVGGNAELVVEGETGHLLASQDPERLATAIKSCLADAELRQRYGAAARQRTEQKFSLNMMVTHYLNLYKKGTLPF